MLFLEGFPPIPPTRTCVAHACIVNQVGGLEITPFPVLHGEDYISHGFLFGPEGNEICYISDVSRVPPETMKFLQRQGPMQLLVCDALLRSRKHPTHFRWVCLLFLLLEISWKIPGKFSRSKGLFSSSSSFCYVVSWMRVCCVR